MQTTENTVASPRGRAQKIRGVVVSDKMAKTCIIEVDRIVRYSLYSKSVMRDRRLFVHDERNEAKVGDKIEAIASRRLSRNKNFRLHKILEKRTAE